MKTVLVNGNVVLEDGEFPFDVAEIYKEARIQAQRLWDGMDALD